MGTFEWGTYTEGAGGSFVKENEMLAYIVNGTPVAVTGVREGVSQQYKSEQWLVDFVDDQGEDRTKSFNKGNPERDGRMMRLKETIEATGEPVEAKFIKVGKRYDVTGAVS